MNVPVLRSVLRHQVAEVLTFLQLISAARIVRPGKLALALLGWLCLGGPRPARAQNDVMLQAFYWDVPVDAGAKNGTWWDNLRGKAASLKNAGFTGIWVPSPAKGNAGIYDMGYGPLDHYDLGNYNQKGTTETRFGSRAELGNMLNTMHQQGMQVYADVILNHMYTGDEHSEANPAVKAYVLNEAKANGTQHQSYPTTEIRWVIPAQTAGDYYIQIKGYNLPWAANRTERGYDLVVDYGNYVAGNFAWELEPNGGGGSFNTFPGSGRAMRGHIEANTDIDEYKITLTDTRDIVIRLYPKKEVTVNGAMQWTDAAATNGLYPVGIWKNGTSLTGALQARTNTKITLPTKTGAGEATLSWDYRDYHPVDANDFVGFESGDGVLPNVKWFGNDLNTYSASVQTKLNNWGWWMANTVGFDGFRMDFVRGFQEPFLASWINNLPKVNNAQRFVVSEYWGGDAAIKAWSNKMSSLGADSKAFDFPLKFSLNELCNGDQNYNMAGLNHAGMVRNGSGNALPSSAIVTFLENHDTGKEHDKWVTKDFKLGYAYILTHEGRPCVFYSHYYGVPQQDQQNGSLTAAAPASLQDDINKLMFARRTYLGGGLAVLSETGNPYPATDTKNVYVARRQGGNGKNGAIVVLNNHATNTLGLWVNSSPAGYQSWTGLTLVNALNPSQTAVVQADGRVNVTAPPRGYAVWVRQNEYVAYSAPAARGTAQTLASPKEAAPAGPAEFRVYPNPANDKLTLVPGRDLAGPFTLKIHNVQGQLLLTREVRAAAPAHEVSTARLKDGYYILSIESAKGIEKQRLLIAH